MRSKKLETKDRLRGVCGALENAKLKIDFKNPLRSHARIFCSSFLSKVKLYSTQCTIK